MKKGLGKALIAAGLSAAVIFSTAIMGMADSINLDTKCSVTISAGDFEDIDEANVVLDLYKVASAVEVPGYDTYAYSVEGAYAEFSDRLSDTSEITSDDWRSLADDAAELTLGSGNQIAKAVDGASAGSAITNLDAGLYLVVARSADLDDYVLTITDDDGNEKLVTIAQSDSHEYKYSPELISLPSKEANEEGVIRTDTPGEWIYDLTGVTMKAEQSDRFNDLVITKTLDRYEQDQPATIVFSVVAEFRGKTVYDDVVALTFTNQSEKSVTISNKIPVGAKVTVTEVYTGSVYESAGDSTVVIDSMPTLDQGAGTVSFMNTMSDRLVPGSGIVNKFKYVENTSGTSEWILEDNTTDNATDSTAE